jgi:transcriptional regulator with XRE-family HTH domain
LSDEIQTTFGKILRKYRLQQQLSQEKLAELADLDRTYISQIERGLKSPSFKALIALARALQVQAHVLVSEVENELDQDSMKRRGKQSDENCAGGATD